MTQGAAPGTVIHHDSQKTPPQVRANTEKNHQQKQLRRTHPAKASEALQDAGVEEAGLGRVLQGLLQQGLDEVDARLDGEHHARLQAARRAQAAQPRLLRALHALHDTQTACSQQHLTASPPVLAAPLDTQNIKNNHKGLKLSYAITSLPSVLI